MSKDNTNTTVNTSCCASCGMAEDDDIKLKNCTACYLVKYCSDDCQTDHKSKHEEACKNRAVELRNELLFKQMLELYKSKNSKVCKKRAAKLRDELLFKQPESSHRGDCPICCLPLPLDSNKCRMTACCSKMICLGCVHANKIREAEMGLKESCPFCREANFSTDEEGHKQRIKRVEVNDPVAIYDEGVFQYMKGNCSGALECYKKAARLGDAEAHLKLSSLYHCGDGVEKDKGKEIHHTEEAAIRGHPKARFLLGSYELENDNIERAVKHFIIAAKQGNDDSMKALMQFFTVKWVEKEILAATLREHQAAVDAAKSPQREAAAQYYGC